MHSHQEAGIPGSSPPVASPVINEAARAGKIRRGRGVTRSPGVGSASSVSSGSAIGPGASVLDAMIIEEGAGLFAAHVAFEHFGVGAGQVDQDEAVEHIAEIRIDIEGEEFAAEA